MSVLYSTDSGGCRSYQKIQNTSKYASSVKPPRQTQTHHVKMDQTNTKSKDSKSNNCHVALLWNWSLRSWAIIQKHAREASLALHVVSILTEKQLDLEIYPWCEGQTRSIGYENKRKTEKKGTIRCGPVSSVEKKENAEENSWAAQLGSQMQSVSMVEKMLLTISELLPGIKLTTKNPPEFRVSATGWEKLSRFQWESSPVTPVLTWVERFDRRGTEPFELFRLEFGQNSFKIQEFWIFARKFKISENFNIF